MAKHRNQSHCLPHNLTSIVMAQQYRKPRLCRELGCKQDDGQIQHSSLMLAINADESLSASSYSQAIHTYSVTIWPLSSHITPVQPLHGYPCGKFQPLQSWDPQFVIPARSDSNTSAAGTATQPSGPPLVCYDSMCRGLWKTRKSEPLQR